MCRGYGEYEIDIEETLRKGLPSAFDTIPPAPLTTEFVNAIPRGTKGAYLLFLDEKMVYAGKTDTRHGFRDRLSRHTDSVRHRVGLDAGRMTFKALRILVFSAFDVEAILIAEMRRQDTNALRWNNSGFGSNDPGRNRDEGEPADFDLEYPIDIDVSLRDIPSGMVTVRALLQAAKTAVPYLLRYEIKREARENTVTMADGPATMRSILTTVAAVLPNEVQITVFDGRIIIYHEEKTYKFARQTWRGQA